jgi:hypothetical protein
MQSLLLASCVIWAVEGLSKKHTTHPPLPRGREGGPCDASIPGSWTGYMGSLALRDEYELIWRGPSFPVGAFTSTFVSGVPGWGLGQGQFSADNTTAVISFDTGVVLHGNVSGDCTTLTWDNGSSWRKSLKKKVHIVAMNHLYVRETTPRTQKQKLRPPKKQALTQTLPPPLTLTKQGRWIQWNSRGGLGEQHPQSLF